MSRPTKNDTMKAATSALVEAIDKKDSPRVAALLAAGADPNEVDGPSGARPLLAAAGGGQVDTVRALLQAGAEIDAVDRHGNTALMEAVYRYSNANPEPFVRILDLLLERGADPDKMNRHEVSPRSLAASIGSSNVEEALEAALARHSKESKAR